MQKALSQIRIGKQVLSRRALRRKLLDEVRQLIDGIEREESLRGQTPASLESMFRARCQTLAQI